ncbi:ATP-binding cassette domain-containing protein [Streptomyces cellulosae]
MTSIDVRDLTKEYGARRAVDDLTFTVPPGRVTGFLGPNGAGKSTTVRLVLGLDRPTSGSAGLGGRPYASLREPLRTVGALLDAGAALGSRTGRDHLRVLAATHRIQDRRVDEVLEETGLAPAARRRVRTYSLGMRQRLGIAAALLGDPEVVMLDEPSNGLDPEGIVWIRVLLRRLADEGRTVLVSSHLMTGTAAFADHLVVLGRGRLLADTPVREFIDARVRPAVRAQRDGHPVGADPVDPDRVLRGRRRVRRRRRLHAGPRRTDGAARRARRNARPVDGTCRVRVLDGRGPAGRCVAAAPSGRLRRGRLTRRQLSVAAGLLEP